LLDPGSTGSRALPELEPEARGAILAWYDAQGRALPFRGTRDPYAILVSEAMAQQTQAARAAESWERFVAAFPSFAALAAASPAAVLRAWRGLGYNRRALALRRTAIEVEMNHGGHLPQEPAELERLPGIGPYTARAVAAIAFGRPVGAVDTNVRRVLTRILAGDGPAPRPAALQAAADRAVPPDRPADWTHALMDLGATHCRPRVTRCEACPARPWCRSAAAHAAPSPIATTLSAGRSRAARERVTPFEATSRWLRGRILDLLRDAPDDQWVEIGAPIGSHGESAVAQAIESLVAEGLAEQHRERAGKLRLPLA
jgi:A/G-specific adenine glycosylase